MVGTWVDRVLVCNSWIAYGPDRSELQARPGSDGDAENARHENAGLKKAAQTCRLSQGVENARLENVPQKYRAGKSRKGKCGTKSLRVENAGAI